MLLLHSTRVWQCADMRVRFLQPMSAACGRAGSEAAACAQNAGGEADRREDQVWHCADMPCMAHEPHRWAWVGGLSEERLPARRMLEGKLIEAKSKKDTLKARAKTAQTSRQIADMVQGLNTSNAVSAFERMEEKVMSLEAEAESTLQVGPSSLMHACMHACQGHAVPYRTLRVCRSGAVCRLQGVLCWRV